MGAVLRVVFIIVAIALFVFWLKAVADYDGSMPDFCVDCDPDICPFNCEKNKCR